MSNENNEKDLVKRQKISYDNKYNILDIIKEKIRSKNIDDIFIKKNFFEIIKLYKTTEEWRTILYILKYNDKLNYDIIRFIHTKSPNLVDWKILKNHKILSPEFIVEFLQVSENKININMINFIDLQKNNKLSIEFIRFLNIYYPEKIDWFIISFYQKINSDKFIIEYHNLLDWNIISYNYQLSEFIIEKFKNKVDWFLISQFQKLSERFILKHIDQIKTFWLKKNKNIDFRFFSFKFFKVMSYDLINFNEYYKYNILVKKIQRWWIDILYRPNGIFYEKMHKNFKMLQQ